MPIRNIKFSLQNDRRFCILTASENNILYISLIIKFKLCNSKLFCFKELKCMQNPSHYTTIDFIAASVFRWERGIYSWGQIGSENSLFQTLASRGLNSSFEDKSSLGTLIPNTRWGEFWNSITPLLRPVGKVSRWL